MTTTIATTAATYVVDASSAAAKAAAAVVIKNANLCRLMLLIYICTRTQVKWNCNMHSRY